LTTPPSPTLRQRLRDSVSPQALVAAVAAAAVAALVGKLTAYLFVALAIFFFAVAALSLYSRAQTPAREAGKRRFLLVFSGIWLVLGLGTLGLGIRGELTKEVRGEENLVSSLSAGQDLSRFSAALGPPDTKRPAGTYLIYQFQRRRETLQAVVNRVGVVVSYAVYAKTRDFHPSFDHGADVRLNSTAVDGGTPSAGLAAMGYCAAHKSGYFEAFGGTNASGARYFVLGVSNANTSAVSTAAICPASGGPLTACLQDVGNTPSAEDLACMRGKGVGRRLRSTLKANVYIETAPGARLLPVMLYPPDEAANLGA
jgi:hypothetical protein